MAPENPAVMVPRFPAVEPGGMKRNSVTFVHGCAFAATKGGRGGPPMYEVFKEAREDASHSEHE